MVHRTISLLPNTRMSKWTEQNIPDLGGKVALVTGANSGLGLATAGALAAKGAQVVISCRSADKAAQATTDIRRSVPEAKLDFLPLDLADLESVREAAATFQLRYSQLDLLINNAGVLGLPYTQTKDGFEMLFGTNHLGHFALTGLLIGTLRATPEARIVTVSSVAARSGELPLEDLNWKQRKYSRAGAYGQSKLANLVFALELERRLRRAGIKAISVASHPGYAATNVVFARNATPTLGRHIWNLIARIGNALIAQPAALGALPSLYAATASDVRGGDYLGPSGPGEFRGYPRRVKPTELAQDLNLGDGLWKKSQQLTGVNLLP